VYLIGNNYIIKTVESLPPP